jgi:hypothetical protein
MRLWAMLLFRPREEYQNELSEFWWQLPSSEPSASLKEIRLAFRLSALGSRFIGEARGFLNPSTFKLKNVPPCLASAINSHR